MKIYGENDADLEILKDKSITVVGFGSQGRAFALNLRDSGLDVSVALDESSESIRVAAELDFPVIDNSSVSQSDIIMLLIPDHLHGDYYRIFLEGRIRRDSALVFAHGFSIAFGDIEPPDGVLCALVAPHGPGNDLRSLYLDGSGLSCFVAAKPDRSRKSLAIAIAIAHAAGCTRAGAFKTTFEKEAIGDLFGEQSLLCGGLLHITAKAFDILVEKGLPPENAYLETVHQIDLLANLLKEHGTAGMLERISKTAAYGALKMQRRLEKEPVEQAFLDAYDNIDSGEFAREWTMSDTAMKRLGEFIRQQKRSQLDKTAAKLRRIIEDAKDD